MVNITDHLPFNFQNKDQAIASTSRLRAGSPSPHPSVATADSGTTSCSGSSLRPQGGRPVILKEAALSVRLVRGRDGGYRGTINRGRLGGFGEERGIEWSANGIADDLVRQFTPENTLSSEVVVQEEVPPDIVPLDDVDRNAVSGNNFNLSLFFNFRIDIGFFGANWESTQRWLEDSRCGPYFTWLG